MLPSSKIGLGDEASRPRNACSSQAGSANFDPLAFLCVLLMTLLSAGALVYR
jgi:hypothetical protein